MSTIERKIKYLKALKSNDPKDMIQEVLEKPWCSKSKNNALDTVIQYAEFLGLHLEKPRFRVYQDQEMYVPDPEMVKKILYRITKPELKAMVMISIETGASASEIYNLTWKDINLQKKTITIRGIKGHRTYTYKISDDLVRIFLMIQRKNEKIWSIKNPRHINDTIRYHRQKLYEETGNPDFLKIHFHTFRHFAISWKYFKTKDIVETQRFARHCNIQNTLKYVHIVKSWIKDNQYDVVYAETKEELTKYLKEGFELITKTEWGYCLRKSKTIF